MIGNEKKKRKMLKEKRISAFVRVYYSMHEKGGSLSGRHADEEGGKA